jgi:hypothetical protein
VKGSHTLPVHHGLLHAYLTVALERPTLGLSPESSCSPDDECCLIFILFYGLIIIKLSAFHDQDRNTTINLINNVSQTH